MSNKFICCLSIFIATFGNGITPCQAAKNDNTKIKELIYEIDLNKQQLKHEQVILLRREIPYLPEEELKTWRLKAFPPCVPLIYEEKQYYSLSCFADSTYKIDSQQMLLNINLPARYFKRHAIEYSTKEPTIIKTPTKPGAFINYDIEGEHIDNKTAANQSSINALFDGGIFAKLGVVESQVLTRILEKHTENTVRLNSDWTYDDPSTMRRYKLGDSISEGGEFGRAITFGGFQISKNFSLNPELYPYPLPFIQPGTAYVPSVVDFYLNNVRLFRRDVPPGPFDIQQFPIYLSGPGTIKVVTRDIFGNEQIMTVPVYFTRELLKKGLHQYSLSIGFIRQNFGIDSFNYNRFVLTGMDRVGVTNRFTAGGLVEFTKKQQMIGTDIDYLPSSHIGVIAGGVAASRRQTNKFGVMGLLGFNTTRDKWNLGFETKWMSHDFTQLGYEPDALLPISQSSVFGGVKLSKKSNVSLSFISVDNRDNGRQDFISVQYSQTFFSHWLFHAMLSSSLSGQKTRSLMLSINRFFGKQQEKHFVINGLFTDQTKQGSVALSQSLPNGPGWGYRVNAEEGDNSRQYGRFSYQNKIGTYHAEVALQHQATNYRLNALGGLLYFNNQLYLSRFSRDGFAVVQIPKYKDINVFYANQPMGKTDKNGEIFIPQLTAYGNNQIRIDPDNLPINVRVDNEIKYAVPYYRSGVIVSFPTKRIYAATFRLILPSGQPIPEGANITVKGQEEDYFVGENGETYVENLSEHNELKATIENASCNFTIDMPKTMEPLLELGDVICKLELDPELAKKNAETADEKVNNDAETKTRLVK